MAYANRRPEWVLPLRDYPVFLLVEDSEWNRSDIAFEEIRSQFPGIQTIHVSEIAKVDRAVGLLQKKSRLRGKVPRLIVAHNAAVADAILLRVDEGAFDVVLTDLHMLYDEIPGDMHYRINPTDRDIGRFVPAGFAIAIRAARGNIAVLILSDGHHHQERIVYLLGPVIASPLGIGSGPIVYFEADNFSASAECKIKDPKTGALRVARADVRYVAKLKKICRVEDCPPTSRQRIKDRLLPIRNAIFHWLRLNPAGVSPSPTIKGQPHGAKVRSKLYDAAWWIRAYIPFKDYWAADLRQIKAFDMETGEYLGRHLYRKTQPVKNWGEALRARLSMQIRAVTG